MTLAASPATASGFAAPAKLNLMLHIVGRRDDGYHQLQTVFQFLDYGDRLYFTPTDDGRISMDDVAGVTAADNLIIRAAELLQKHSGSNKGVHIRIDKRLPMGGGLGGGSSDAATTLVALNQLWQLDYTRDALARLGLRLGADIPVFVHGAAAWGEGVGERLTPVSIPEPWYLVVRPDVSVSTGALFQDPELTRNCPPITIADFVAGCRDNVFLPVVRKRYPQVAQVIELLENFGEVRLTGSGSCLFLEFADEASAQAVAAQVPDALTYFVARGTNTSPLYA